MKTAILMIPTYNGAKYLPALLDSIAAQTYPNIRVYIRDDGSTDDTVQIIRDKQSIFTDGKQLILVNELDGDWDNKGPHENFRHILQHMEDGDYYFFCDQDDVWALEKVQRAVTSMEQYPAGTPVLYYHNNYICDGALNIQNTLPDRPSYTPDEMKNVRLCKVIMTGTWAGVGMAQAFNHSLKKLAFDTGDFTPSIAVDCWISWVVAGANGALCYDSKPLAYYRRHEGTFSSGDATGLKRYRDWQKHMNRHCDNITNGIRDFRRLYRPLVSEERKAFLDIFYNKKRMPKLFYPHRLRTSLMEEVAFRILILIGKI